ncbi:MAG: hypothetical protein EOP52_11500 [Sphingobacteriales bacterium]|nr:MAG: hypothetical protein EOP52_11500 [Sphingobacteriales bacterium]
MQRWTEAQQHRRLFIYVLILFGLTVWLRLVVIGLYKVDCGGSDENVLFGVQRLLLGEALYQNPSQPNFAIVQYTPLYYYTVAGVAKLFGIQALDVQSIYVTARMLNFIFNLLTVWIAGSMLRTFSLKASRIWTFAMPVILILTSHYYTRIDSLHLLFFVSAMAVYVRSLQRPHMVLFVVSALFAGACVMTKQSGMLAIGIIGCSMLFLERTVLKAVLWGLLSVGFAATIAWIGSGTNWLAFYQNAYLGLKNGVDWSWPVTIFTSQFYFEIILFYVLPFIIAWDAFRYTTNRVYRFMGLGAVLSFLFALITGFKVGSSNNYFIEEILFSLLGLPVLLQSEVRHKILIRLGKWPLTIGRFSRIAFLALITSKTMGFFTAVYIEKRLVSERDLYTDNQALHQYFRNQLGLQNNQYVYCTRRDFLDNFFLSSSLMANRDVIFQTWTGAPGTFDYTRLHEGLNTGLVRYVVTPIEDSGINQLTREEMPMMQFDTTRFQPIATVNRYRVYQFTGVP